MLLPARLLGGCGAGAEDGGLQDVVGGVASWRRRERGDRHVGQAGVGEVGSAGLCGVVGWYGLRGGDREEIGVGVMVIVVVGVRGWGWVREGKG